jgi:hypothetical protein
VAANGNDGWIGRAVARCSGEAAEGEAGEVVHSFWIAARREDHRDDSSTAVRDD